MSFRRILETFTALWDFDTLYQIMYLHWYLNGVDLVSHSYKKKYFKLLQQAYRKTRGLKWQVVWQDYQPEPPKSKV
jgi:hypothetical protein